MLLILLLFYQIHVQQLHQPKTIIPTSVHAHYTHLRQINISNANAGFLRTLFASALARPP